jgi:hypothetical protein
VTAISPLQLGTLLLLLWAALLWLHLRRPRAVRRSVPFLQLWEALPSSGQTRTRWRVQRSWALARALLVATLLAFALHDPAPRRATQSTLLVLDAGAHMQARDVQPNRFEQARALARGLLDSGRELRIAQLDGALTPLSTWSHDPRALARALDTARVSHEATRFAAALPFALAELRGRPQAELLLISDGAFELPDAARRQLEAAGIALHQLRVGTSSHNVGIRSFAVRAQAWDATRCEAMVEIENADDQRHELELTLSEAGRPIDVRPISLAAHGKDTLFFSLGASQARLSARLSQTDDQPLDDVAYAVLSQPPPRRVLLVGGDNRYLESALALDPSLRVERVSPDAYASAAGYDAVIFDRFAPDVLPAAPSLWLAPEAKNGSPYRVLGSVDRPFFEQIERDDPLLRWVALRDVNIRRAQRVQLDPHDKVLARSRLGPLLVTGERSGQPFVALTFDVRESDLVLRSAWPILLARVLERLTATRSELAPSLTLGRSRALAVDGASAQLQTPSGRRRELPVRQGQVWIQPEEPGFHILTAAGSQQLLAANPDADAGLSIAPRRLAAPPKLAARGRFAAAGFTSWWLLAAAALLVLGVDSWSRGRR